MNWNRIAQGSKNGPQLFGRLSAMIARLTQGVFDPTRARLHVYIDDPIVILRGVPSVLKTAKAKLILIWRSLGLDLAFRKGQAGSTVQWVGHSVHCDVGAGKVDASIKQEFMTDLADETEQLLRQHTVTFKRLRSYTGRVNHVCNLMLAWRPFTDQLWAALNSDRSKPSKAPRGQLWTRQLKQALRWISAFMKMEGTAVTRSFPLSAYLGSAAEWTFVTDASPFGLGAIAIHKGVIVAYICSDLDEHEFNNFGFVAGDSRGQQVWGCLGILVALRAWKHWWKEGRFTIALHGDNVTALVMALRMNAPAGGCKEIAKELALEFTYAAFVPMLVEHIPGIANELADALSRRKDPSRSGSWRIPPCLDTVTATEVPPRDASYYFL